MLLGNKVSLAPGLCHSLLFLPRWRPGQGSLAGHEGTGRYMLVTFPIPTNCSVPFLLQVDSAQDRVVKREDGEKLAKVGEVPEDVPEDVHRKWSPGDQSDPKYTWEHLAFFPCHALPFLLICSSFKFLLTPRLSSRIAR